MSFDTQIPEPDAALNGSKRVAPDTLSQASKSVDKLAADIRESLEQGNHGTQLRLLRNIDGYLQPVSDMLHLSDLQPIPGVLSINFSNDVNMLLFLYPQAIMVTDTLGDAVKPSVSHEDAQETKIREIPGLHANPTLLTGLESFLKTGKISGATQNIGVFLDADYENLTAESPTDESLWIEWALSHFPKDIEVPLYSTRELPKKSFDKSISILGKALQSNRSSPSLWALYLELYSNRGQTEDVRKVFDQSVSGPSFCRSCEYLWWRWFMWEIRPEDKLAVLKKFLLHVLDDEDGDFSAVLFLEIVISIEQVYVLMDQSGKGINFLHKVLAAKKENIRFVALELGETWEPSGLPDFEESWCYDVMPMRLHFFFWIYYVREIAFKSGENLTSYSSDTDQHLFYAYPFDFKIIDPAGALVEINWNSATRSPKDVDSNVMQDARYLLAYIHDGARKVASSDKGVYLAAVRNLVGFLTWEGDVSMAGQICSEALGSRNDLENELLDLAVSVYQVL